MPTIAECTDRRRKRGVDNRGSVRVPLLHDIGAYLADKILPFYLTDTTKTL